MNNTPEKPSPQTAEVLTKTANTEVPVLEEVVTKSTDNKTVKSTANNTAKPAKSSRGKAAKKPKKKAGFLTKIKRFFYFLIFLALLAVIAFGYFFKFDVSQLEAFKLTQQNKLAALPVIGSLVEGVDNREKSQVSELTQTVEQPSSPPTAHQPRQPVNVATSKKGNNDATNQESRNSATHSTANVALTDTKTSRVASVQAQADIDSSAVQVNAPTVNSGLSNGAEVTNDVAVSETEHRVNAGTSTGSSEASANDDSALAARLQTLSENQQLLQQSLDKITDTQKASWQLGEAVYLVKMANQHLSLTQNAQGAFGLLEAADKVLSEVDSVDVLPARKVLADDIMALKKAAKVDIEQVFFKLSALEKQVKSFTLAAVPAEKATNDATVQTVVAASESDAENSSWNKISQTADAVLNKVVRVREVAKVNPILDAEGHAMLKQNILLLLAQSKLALLQRQGGVFQESLAQVKAYINDNASFNNENASLALDVIGEIERVDINPELPSLSGALQAVSAVAKQAKNSRLREMNQATVSAQNEE